MSAVPVRHLRSGYPHSQYKLIVQCKQTESSKVAPAASVNEDLLSCIARKIILCGALVVPSSLFSVIALGCCPLTSLSMDDVKLVLTCDQAASSDACSSWFSLSQYTSWLYILRHSQSALLFALKLPSLWLPMPLLFPSLSLSISARLWLSAQAHYSPHSLAHFFVYRSFKNRAWPFHFHSHFILSRLWKIFSHLHNHLAYFLSLLLSVPFCSPHFAAVVVVVVECRVCLLFRRVCLSPSAWDERTHAAKVVQSPRSRPK